MSMTMKMLDRLESDYSEKRTELIEQRKALDEFYDEFGTYTNSYSELLNDVVSFLEYDVGIGVNDLGGFSYLEEPKVSFRKSEEDNTYRVSLTGDVWMWHGYKNREATVAKLYEFVMTRMLRDGESLELSYDAGNYNFKKTFTYPRYDGSNVPRAEIKISFDVPATDDDRLTLAALNKLVVTTKTETITNRRVVCTK